MHPVISVKTDTTISQQLLTHGFAIMFLEMQKDWDGVTDPSAGKKAGLHLGHVKVTAEFSKLHTRKQLHFFISAYMQRCACASVN